MLEMPSAKILRIRVDATSYDGAADLILQWISENRSAYICTANVHMLMEAFDDPEFRVVMDDADLVTADGMPVVWGLKWEGITEAKRVYGPDLLLTLCRRAETEGIPVGFYGGMPDVLDAMIAVLRKSLPLLRIVFNVSPPFHMLSPGEDREMTDAIAKSGAKLLFIGLGCPKQERWMAAHRDRLPMVQIGVGAAFDFISGRKPQAPAWMQSAGLEWVFRLLTEPRRLWKRYLYLNPRFVFHFTKELIARRFKKKGNNSG